MTGLMLIGGLVAAAANADTGMLDLSRAVVVTPEGSSGSEQKAVALLLDEVEQRSRIRWPETHTVPRTGTAIVIQSVSRLFQDAIPHEAARQPEGYCVVVGDTGVSVIGNDRRGVLYGVGRLLRELRMSRDRIWIPARLDIATSPKYPLRGHQLGYRPKVNSYDGWTPEMFDRYIGELAVFGANAIELIPPRSDDAPDSPHFVIPPLEMMAKMSALAAAYDLDVWIWHPATGVNYAKPDTVEFALKEWGDIYAKLPRIDAIFVPSGDPGNLEPADLLDFLEKATGVLHRAHPKAQMWVSTQSFNIDKLKGFLDLIRQRQPDWLGGIVFGPQNRMTLAELREAVPARYPIRHYPDITHSVQCQFPVPDWDLAYRFTEQREVINPRPMDFARIIRMYDDYTIGFLTYSEGCNDDVNKTVWSALGWDPETDVVEILRQYARYFIGPEYEDPFAQGLLALERNWQGPLLTNAHVLTTLGQFREMERTAAPRVLLNWRFQQALYRAYYDAYDARRLRYETELEQQADDVLRRAPQLGSMRAMDEAQRILAMAVTAPVAQDLRARVFELAEALFQSIRMQLSVPRYKAIHADRGANLDLIDLPLNNRLWLDEQFAQIRRLASESDRLARLRDIVQWTNPGPGGFYDSLGIHGQNPHLVRDPGYLEDPEFRTSSILAAEYEPGLRMSWIGYAETRYDSPLRMRYMNLDPAARYKARVVYAGDNMRAKLRMTANGIEVHPYRSKEVPIKPVEFDIPPEAVTSGQLELAWTQEPGRGGGGRGCQVAEVWLIRKND